MWVSKGGGATLDAQVWTTIGKAAGLGGISVAALLLLFRDLIRRKFFPLLRATDAYRLLRLMTICATVTAIFGIIAWVVGPSIAPPRPAQINQTISGPGSAAVSNVGGDVNIQINQK